MYLLFQKLYSEYLSSPLYLVGWLQGITVSCMIVLKKDLTFILLTNLQHNFIMLALMFEFKVKGNIKKIEQLKEEQCNEQSNLCLLHLWGLRKSGMTGPIRRGLGQRGRSLPLDPSLFVSEHESTRLLFTAEWCILQYCITLSCLDPQNWRRKSMSQVNETTTYLWLAI